MKIGCTKELKNHEYRVGLMPSNVAILVKEGHEVYIESHAGEGAGFEDNEYIAAGAQVIDDAATIFATCDMIIKVKEPEECEWDLLRPGQILYTYLHLAPNPKLTNLLLDRKVKAVA